MTRFAHRAPPRNPARRAARLPDRLRRWRHRPPAGRPFSSRKVNAVSLAVEKLYPQVQSVVEARRVRTPRIIVFKADEQTRQEEENPVDE